MRARPLLRPRRPEPAPSQTRRRRGSASERLLCLGCMRHGATHGQIRSGPHYSSMYSEASPFSACRSDRALPLNTGPCPTRASPVMHSCTSHTAGSACAARHLVVVENVHVDARVEAILGVVEQPPGPVAVQQVRCDG